MSALRLHARRLAFLLRNGTGPRVLWHYCADHLRYRLVKKGILYGAAKHVAEISAAFEANAVQGQFKETWFDVHIVPWCVAFSKIFNTAEPVKILEIGSWEGRSTLFFLTYFTQARLTAVDTWAGSDELQNDPTLKLQSLEARFDHNLAPCATRLAKRKGSSLCVLPQLLEEEREFDLIYVDGSHFADDVLTDGLNAWRLLKPGGVMIFDDLVWKYYRRARDNPAWPIKVFLKYHSGKYEILSVTTQIILQKK
jgi:predicted O-methyltransferase YrrM